MITKMKRYTFLFEELVKRDFKQKYKRAALGMVWSVLFPLLQLLVMKLVFTQFFGRTTPHYTTYLFAGNLAFNFFREATTGGMSSLMANSGIFTKVNVPKYLFLLSKNVSAILNYLLNLCVFFVFCWLDGITFSPRMVALVFPVCCLILFNIGVGLILSALFVFYRDIDYLYQVFIMLLQYMSAIFYTIDSYEPLVQRLFLCNPLYVYIHYIRVVVIDGYLPSPAFHGLCLLYAAVVLLIGGFMYKKYNHRFLYYV